MGLHWKSLLSLKTPVIVGFVAIWSAGFVFALQLGGGGLAGGLSPVGMRATGVLCALAFTFSVTVAAYRSVQAWVIEPARAADFSPKEFYCLALIAGVLAVLQFSVPIVWEGNHGW